MSLPKTPIKDIDLDEFARRLREYQSLRDKGSPAGAKENLRMVGGKAQGSVRESARDQPAHASSFRPGQISKSDLPKNPNIDDLERQLREVASSALRKSPAPLQQGDPSLALKKPPGGRSGLPIDGHAPSAATGAGSQLGLMQARWRPVILKTYGEQSVAWRCARSLAVPLLLLFLGAGALVVLSPDGALSVVERLVDDVQAKQGRPADHKALQTAVATGTSFEQPGRSNAPAEASPPRVASPGVTPSGEAGVAASVSLGSNASGAISSTETSSFTDHGAPEPMPIRVWDDHHGQSPSALDPVNPSPSVVKQLLDGDSRPAAPPASTHILAATGSPNTVDGAGASTGEVGFEALPPVIAGLAAPEAPISPTPTVVTPPARPDSAASFSVPVRTEGWYSSNEVSETSAASAALAAPEIMTSSPMGLPTTRPNDAASDRSAAKSIEPKSDPNDEAVAVTPSTALADLPQAQASGSLLTGMRSPTPDAAGASRSVSGSEGSKPGSIGDAISGASPPVSPGLVKPEAVTPPPRAPSITADRAESASDSFAASSVEVNSISGSVPEVPEPPVSGLSAPPASMPLPIGTALPKVATVSSPSGSAEWGDSKLRLTDDAGSEVTSSNPASDSVARLEAGQNIASDELRHARPSGGETVSDPAAPSAGQAKPSLSFNAASRSNTFAQVTPDPVEGVQTRVAELIVPQGESGAAGAALPLPVSLSSSPAGATILIHGLAAGSTLNVGRPVEKAAWQVTAGELRDAVLRPPPDFAGVMELALELRLADDSVADRKTLHLEWAGRPGAQGIRPAFVIRHLDSDEIATLLKRGESFIASGDLASARLVLQRAAEAGDAQAALSLAGTFDPTIVGRLRLQGQKPDLENARIWYQRAQELGSATATRRLQLLAVYDQ